MCGCHIFSRTFYFIYLLHLAYVCHVCKEEVFDSGRIREGSFHPSKKRLHLCDVCSSVCVRTSVRPSVRACLNIYISYCILCIQPAIHWVLTTQNTITSLFGHQFYRLKVKNVYKYIPFKSVSAVSDLVILEPCYGPWNGRKKFVKFPNVVDCRCW